jgi:unspecific monooxygenase
MTSTDAFVFNPLDPAFRADPYAGYRQMPRVSMGIFGAWLLTKHADCVALLRDHRASSDERNSTMFQQFVEASGGDPAQALGVERPFLFMDPPDHTRLRGLVSKAFTPKVVEGLRPRIERIVAELFDAAAARGTLEIVEDLAYPLPVVVICEMLGVPTEDHETFQGWSRELARSLDPEFVLPPEVIAQREAAILSFQDYFRDLIATRRRAPRDDLLSALIAAEDDGQRLTEGELLSTVILLLVAGHETTVNLVANGVLALLRHPAELARLRADTELAKSAVEEVLRFDPPVQMTVRVLLADTEIAGQPMSKGEQAVILIGAANRDPDEFPEPDRFDVTRNPPNHLAFSNGIHFCLGAPLARAEGRAALAAFAARVVNPRLAVEDVDYKENIVLRGLAALPVDFDAIV